MELEDLKKDNYLKHISDTNSIPDLEDIRIKYLGKTGIISNLMKKIQNLSNQEKKDFGQEVNAYKIEILNAIEQQKEQIQLTEINARLKQESLDLSLPIRSSNKGTIHPLSQATAEILEIFGSHGFNKISGPDIDSEENNFTLLNFADHHPAKQMHDTFYMNSKNEDDKKNLLRTHTSTMQVRYMQENKPPFRVVAPGRVYRCDWDMTHTPMFHQVEALVIDKNITMAHLKDFLIDFLQKFFENDDLSIRFRPSFFPFTEPSAEIDIGCSWQGKELLIGGKQDWLEVLGAGMVHPNVLRNVGIDPEEYQGFALGMGIERLAMLKYGINDLRKFFESDLRWLRHYGFSYLDIPSIVGGLTR
jgi:phenylalanyl-tRNA synthetase alpha chain